MTLLASAWCVAAFPTLSLYAQEAPPAAAQPQAASAMTNLINKLTARGVLSKQDSAELLAQAEADSADLRVEAAEAALAAAKADAAVARARAAAAQAVNAAKQAAGATVAANQLAARQVAAARILLGQSPVDSAPAPSPVAQEPIPSPVAPVAAAEPAPPPAAAVAPVEAAPPAPSAVVAAMPSPSAEIAPPPVAEAAPAPSAATEPMTAPQAVISPAEAPSAAAPSPADGSAPTASAIVGQTEGQVTSVASVLGGTDNSGAPAPSATAAESAAVVEQAPNAAPEAQAQPAPSPVGNNDQAAPTPVVRTATSAGDETGPPKQVAEVLPRDSARAAADAAGASDVSDDSVRVAYVPEVVKRQIREEVKDEVLADMRKDKSLGSNNPVPDWVTRFTLYGDIRIREEGIINHSTNDDTGAFPSFNAINTGSPYDPTGTVNPPFLDVDQNRERMRLRARLGAAIDMSDGFTAGIRLATGNDDNPVTENQTFGASGNAQGGDFSKYAVWIDRAYLKYQSSGDPSRAFTAWFGRFDNPFFSTSLIWANEIGFDGVAVKIPLKVHVGGQVSDSVKPFIVAGFFPVYNTDLNYATDNPAKFSSYDKWLEAAQIGADWKVGSDFAFKSAAAYYEYKNIEGQLSTPYTPVTSSDAGSTDDSRPSFAQNGNTYMELRDIVPNSLNDNGTIDQWQYYGLATPFRDVAFTQRIEYNHFEPFQISLTGEFVKNVAFNEQVIAAQAVNNLDSTGRFVGGNKGWITTLRFGDALLNEGGKWNLGLGYRSVESDAVVDGFNDADFGGVLTGTNLKGLTLDANIALTPSVSIGARWMSATAIAGPVYKNDLLQFDINGRF